MNESTKQILVSAAIAGIIGVGTVSKVALADHHDDGKGKCTQANECKGKGACKSAHCAEKDKNHCNAKNDCHGKNSCKNHVFEATKAECDKVKGKWAKG